MEFRYIDATSNPFRFRLSLNDGDSMMERLVTELYLRSVNIRVPSCLDIAQLMNVQAASFCFDPVGIPQPCAATPGKRPAGPAGIMENPQVAADLASFWAIWTRNVWLFGE